MPSRTTRWVMFFHDDVPLELRVGHHAVGDHPDRDEDSHCRGPPARVAQRNGLHLIGRRQQRGDLTITLVDVRESANVLRSEFHNGRKNPTS